MPVISWCRSTSRPWAPSFGRDFTTEFVPDRLRVDEDSVEIENDRIDRRGLGVVCHHTLLRE
jgi:hypothetical protein